MHRVCPWHFAGDTNLGGMASTPEGHTATWMNWDRLEHRAGRSLMVF